MSDKEIKKTSIDVHSYAKPSEAKIKHLDLDIVVDFENQILKGVATITFDKSENADTLILDTKNLNIQKITDAKTGEELQYSIGKADQHMGSALSIKLNAETNAVNIKYSTSKDAEALQWLSPEQTLDKKFPFLFTQSQAILARTWIPLQDSPGIRFTYSAKVTVPKELIALMSAENPKVKNDSGIYSFNMPQPIPAYLMALAVGNIEYNSLSSRSGVYAEPAMIKKATNEFIDLEKMIRAAEDLYGKYKWGIYDVLVLPPSFPFGGMENPRLTFATPTIIAGDRSLTSLIAHELAHSWSGNLVTNATWDDFWLNEGFTVYFENRIMEKLYGREYAEMLEYLGYQSLVEEVKEMVATNPDTKLKLDLKGRNPDDGVSSIAYEKGYLFLRNIEEAVGRAQWDKFLEDYFQKFQFSSMNTEDFLEYLKGELIKNNDTLLTKINIEGWVYKPGIPENHPLISSKKFQKVTEEIEGWTKSDDIKSLKTTEWSSHEWVYFIKNLPDNLTSQKIKILDQSFSLSNSGNAEIQFVWYLYSIKHNYTEALPAMKKFLTSVGRRRFILPLYKELIKTESGKQLAKEIYAQARLSYHFVARNSIDQILM